jgi:drug/metabolite transporter (DMT)-like permease
MERAQQRQLAGILLSLGWVALAAFQGVYTGNIVQGIDPIVLLVACATVTAAFANVIQLRQPARYAALVRRNVRLIIWVNLLTAATWSTAFACLRFIEPTAAETFTFAVTPIATFLSALAMRRSVGWLASELVASVVMVIAGAGLGIAIFRGNSSVGQIAVASAAAGIAMAAVSGLVGGVMISYLKQLADAGFTTWQTMAARFLFVIPAGIAYCVATGNTAAAVFAQAGGVVLLAGLGMILPSYVSQLGLERTEPTTAALIGALTPAATFAMQQADGRLSFSPTSMVAAFAIVVAVAWSATARVRAAAPRVGAGLAGS